MKMILSSFYNTLINDEDSIPQSTMLEIDRIRRNNNLFTIITNRVCKDVLFYNYSYPFIDYIISLNGSLIYDVKNNKYIFEEKISKKDIELVNKIFSNYKIFYYTNNVYVEEVNTSNKIYKIEIEINKKDINNFDDININLNKSIFVRNKKYYLEFTSSKVNVYNSVKYLCDKKKIDINEIISIIGNESEKGLLQLPNTYIIGNSPKSLKELTYKRTKSNNSMGVELILKKC